MKAPKDLFTTISSYGTVSLTVGTSTQIFDVEVLSSLIKDATVSTYPKDTLVRRLNLLNPKEVQKLGKKLYVAIHAMEDIDEIISDRADKENDEWP